jgi:hypothetical protein
MAVRNLNENVVRGEKGKDSWSHRNDKKGFRAGGPPSAAGGPGSGNYDHKGAAAIASPVRLSDKDLEAKFRGELQQDWEGSKQAYRKKNGNLISADEAKEMSPDFLADRSRSMAVHEPVSDMMKEIYAEDIKKPPAEGHSNSVVFTAGAPGAGKTTALNNVPKLQALASKAHLVYDMTMADPDSGSKKIDMARAAGKGVSIIYTHRDPVEAFRNGILKRATSQEKEFGSGRIIPIDEAAGQYAKIQKSLATLRDRYKDDPMVTISSIDNSRGAGKAREVPFEDIPKITDSREQLMVKMKKAADEEYLAGHISKHVYESAIRPSTGTHS